MGHAIFVFSDYPSLGMWYGGGVGISLIDFVCVLLFCGAEESNPGPDTC